MIAGYIITQTNSRPFYIYSTDIEPDYLMSSLLIMDGNRPWSVHHPGTWIHFLSAFVLNLSSAHPVENTEYSLNILRTGAIYFNSICIFFAVIVGFRDFQYKILGLILFSYIFPSSIYYLNYFGADSFVFGLAVLLTSLFFYCYIENFSNKYHNLLLGFVMGICLNTKVTFIPIFLIIILSAFISDLLKRRCFYRFQSLKLFLISTIIFICIGFPVALYYPIHLFLSISAFTSVKVLFLTIPISFLILYSISFLTTNYDTCEIFFEKYTSKMLLVLLAFMWMAIFYKEVWSNSYVATEKWRNLAPLHIFFIGFLLHFWVKSTSLNRRLKLCVGVSAFITCLLLSVITYKTDQRLQLIQQADVTYVNQFVDESIKAGYETYIWTGAGNSSHTYSPENFWYWADYRYAGSHYEGSELLTNQSEARFFNIRGIRDAYIIGGVSNGVGETTRLKDNVKKNIKALLVKFGMYREPPLINTYGLNLDSNKHRIIISDIELQITFQNLSDISLERLLRDRYGLFFKRRNIKLGSQDFVIFEN